MKKQILIALFGIFALAACSGENPNSDLYDKSNLAYASQAIIPANDPTFDNYSYLNLAVQWGNFIDNQTMLGVYFPHDIHRQTLRGTTFLNSESEPQEFITGCASCHKQDSSKSRLFMQEYLAETNRKIAGTGLSNPAHEFCWTTCHNQIAEPNNAPSRNHCASCHRIENTFK